MSYKKSLMIDKTPHIICSVLQVLDGGFTLWGVVNYGSEVEMNPIVRTLIEIYGPLYGIILIKTISLILILLHYINTKAQLVPLLWFVNIVYTFVVLQWMLIFIKMMFKLI